MQESSRARAEFIASQIQAAAEISVAKIIAGAIPSHKKKK